MPRCEVSAAGADRIGIYTGVGSRQTPARHLTTMIAIGQSMARRGWLLRSGAAAGADSAYEAGALRAGGQTEIWLPWAGFAGHLSGIAADDSGLYGKAMQIAQQHHPAWHRLTRGARALMARNVFQVLGRDLRTPSTFLVCYAPSPKYNHDGDVVDVAGGTGLAVRIAASYSVPVCHLGYHASCLQVRELILQTHAAREDGRAIASV